MKGIRRIRQRLCALPLALACLMGLAACGGPDFGSFSKELTFGDKQISDTQTTYVMKIPEGKLGDLIGPSQIQWVIDQYGDPPAHTGAVAVGTKKAAKDLLRKSPELQCRALENTYQEESSDEGKWEYKDSSCRKQRKLSWLEKTLWNMYQVQSDSTIEWLSTSRNTLVAANDTVSTLQANATPNYDSWFAPVNRYLRIAQGVLVAAAAISLIVLSARIVWNIGQGGEGRLLDRIGWILLGVLLGSSCASIALTFFSRSSGGNPDLPSWTPGGGTTFFLSDYIRMQVDPFLIIAPELAARAMAQIMDQYAAGGASNDVTLTLTFRYTDRDGKYLEAGEAARRISLLLPSIREQIAQAGGGAARALGMEEITRMVRVAYDPAAQETIEESDEPPYIAWEDCGPLMHEAGWSHYAHDSGLSRTWEMVDPPQSNVTADTLTRLLSPLADCDRKRVTVLYRMLPPDKTMFMAEQNRQKAANQVSQEKRATVRSMSQIGKANRQAVETNQGAVMVFFGMLVTVTVSRGEQESQRLEAASRAVEQAAGGAKIDLRPCYGAQDTGFAASLPLGLNVRSYTPAGPLGRLLS